MIIGIDLDEVLADLVNPLLLWHNEKYGTNLQREKIKSYNLWESWGGARDEAIGKFYEFYKSTHFNGVYPVIGSQNGVKQLSLNNELIVITSRPHDIYDDTKKWIEKYFPNKFNSVELTNQWSKSESGGKKSTLCERLGVEVMIEDSLDYAQECASTGMTTLLLDCPWNRQNETVGVKRVLSWEEIVRELKSY